MDTVALVLAWALAHALVSPASAGSWRGIAPGVAAITAVGLALIALQHLDQSKACTSRVIEGARLTRVAVGCGVASALLSALRGTPSIPTTVLGTVLTLIAITTARGGYDAWLRAERASGRFIRPVAVGGRNGDASAIIDLLREHPELGYRTCGVVGDSATARKHGVPWLGPLSDADIGVLQSEANGIILSATAMTSKQLNLVMRRCLDAGLHVQIASGLQQFDHRRLRMSPLAHEPFFYLERADPSSIGLACKRILDVVMATAVLVISAPVLIAAVAAIWLDDRGPVFFRQVRVGRDGRPFTLIKLRTMYVDAQERLATLTTANERGGPLFKVERDPRVTRVGGLLRATSVDELPQIFNVLGGSMSMVGPRPALPSEVAAFDDELRNRHRLAPGMTGLWQIEARDNPSFAAYRRLDLFYVENWSLSLDVAILLGTLPAVVIRAVRSVGRRRGRIEGLPTTAELPAPS